MRLAVSAAMTWGRRLRGRAREGLAALLGLLLFASAAGAQQLSAGRDGDVERPTELSVWDRPWLVEAGLGFGTPVGLAGLTVERRLGAVAAVRAGVGWNGYSPHGAGMIRLRHPDAPALNLGAGISGGRYETLCILCEEPIAEWDLAFFNNYELSVELRARGGFTFRAYCGYGFLMNARAYECPECDEDETPRIDQGVPYLGIGLGGAF